MFIINFILLLWNLHILANNWDSYFEMSGTWRRPGGGNYVCCRHFERKGYKWIHVATNDSIWRWVLEEVVCVGNNEKQSNLWSLSLIHSTFICLVISSWIEPTPTTTMCFLTLSSLYYSYALWTPLYYSYV